MSFQVVGHPAADRAERVRQLKEMGFGWADLEDEAYWVDQAVAMDPRVWEELQEASGLLWTIFDKAARFIIGQRDLYELLSIPEVLWDGLDAVPPEEPGLLSRYARFDFSVGLGGTIKLLELNADTPTGYVESSVATPWMCSQHGLWTPNTAMPAQVRHAFADAPPAYAACIAYGKHEEDSGTIDMLVRHMEQPVVCVDTLELWVDEGVLRDASGQAIDSLFALYPKEWMGVDDGGEALAYSIETGRLRILNSPHAVILQSKGLQAVIWGLHELKAPFFTETEHDAIEAYMLPTYNEPVFDGDYVEKSMFGREGGSVRIYGAGGGMEIKDQDGFDTSVFFRPVYQARADLPRIRLHDGEYHLLTGVFMIHGEACGLLGRAGGLITGNSSRFVAMGVRKD